MTIQEIYAILIIEKGKRGKQNERYFNNNSNGNGNNSFSYQSGFYSNFALDCGVIGRRINS